MVGLGKEQRSSEFGYRILNCPLEHVIAHSSAQDFWLGLLECMFVRSSAPDACHCYVSIQRPYLFNCTFDLHILLESS